jgi:uncharacterized protein YjbI with pentapeptide repeats
MAGRYPCGRSLYDQDKCIFHSTRIDKDPDRFSRELLPLMQPDHTLDCTSFIVPEKVRAFEGHTFAWDVSFRHAVFLGSCSFAEAQFIGKADFTGAQFTRVEFAEAQFNEPALFAHCQFGGDSTFAGARFQDLVRCHHAHFSGPLHFSRVKIGGRIDFSRAEFEAPVLFTASRFRSAVNFTGSQFHSTVSFARTRFADEVFFSETGFSHPSEYGHDTAVDMTEVSFERPEKVHFYLVDAGRMSFLKTSLQQVDFTDVRWAPRTNGRAALWDELRQDGVKDYAELARLYRQLRVNFEKDGDHRAAADFRYGQMEMRRLDVLGGNPASRMFRRTFSLLTCYKVLSDYGENPGRAAAWLIVVVGVFAVLFAFWGIEDVSPEGGWFNTMNAGLRNSVAAFTMQTGSIIGSLTAAGQWLVILERCMGPVLLVVWGLAVIRSIR